MEDLLINDILKAPDGEIRRVLGIVGDIIFVSSSSGKFVNNLTKERLIEKGYELIIPKQDDIKESMPSAM